MISTAQPEILISAGEASGDMYAARLSAALHSKTGACLFGLGGAQMRQAGVEALAESSEVAVVGISEALRRVPAALRILNLLERESARRKPALAILVDFPDFNLRLGLRLQKQGVRIVYFISPQVWAWREKRLRLIKRLVERVLVIFPFEEKFYRDAGVPMDYIGHPLVDMVKPGSSRAEFAARHGLDPHRPIVALLPGSRPTEIAHNLPAILVACQRLAADPHPQFVIAAATGLRANIFPAHPIPGTPIQVVEGETYDALAAADCAIVSSGTATVEAALLGTPMVVVYRVSRATAFIARRLVRTPYFSMVNLIMGRQIVPELIQEKFTAVTVASETLRLLSSSDARSRMKSDLAEVRAKLGPSGAIERAADIIAGLLPAGTSPATHATAEAESAILNKLDARDRS